MKKIFTLIAAMAVTAGAMANDYTGPLSVLINGYGGTQESTIDISKQDAQDELGHDLYTLSIKNFSLNTGEQIMNVGNIVLPDMPVYDFNDKKLIVTNQVVTIAEGDDPEVEFWYGPYIGEVPISMVAKFNEETATVDIVIDMRSSIEQLIYVNFDNNVAPGPQPEPGKKGDLNGDGSVNAGDVSALYELILNPEE